MASQSGQVVLQLEQKNLLQLSHSSRQDGQ